MPTNGVAQHLGTWVRLVEHQTHATKTHRLNLLRYIHSVGHFLPLRIHLSNSRRWAFLPSECEAWILDIEKHFDVLGY